MNVNEIVPRGTMGEIAKLLKGLLLDIKENNGWAFDYDTLHNIAIEAEDYEDSISMEEVESVLLAIIELYD